MSISPDDILVDLETECVRDLLGNLAAAHAWIAPFHLDHSSISSLEGPLGPKNDGVAGSYIGDDICISPKHGEGAAASKAWLSGPFYAGASARLKGIESEH